MKNLAWSGAGQKLNGWRAILMVAFVCLSLCGRTNAQQNISLAWNSAPGATGYALYLGTAGGPYTRRINVGTNTTVTLSGVPANQINSFVVTAYNAAGLESLASNEADFSATNQTTPTPTNPVVSATQRLTITNNGRLLISAPGAANQTWLLQGSTNLVNWGFIYTNQAGQRLSYTNAIPQGESWHFYRALAVIGGVNLGSIALASSNHSFSANAVGYVRINAARGNTLLANPFDCGNNTVAALLPVVPAGSVLYKYTTGAGYASNVFSGGHWSVGSMTLAPGEGAFLNNPTRASQKLIFVGQVLENTVTNFIPTGYSITSPMIPLANSLATLPATNGDLLQCYSGRWITYTNQSGAWVGSSRTGPLTLEPGGAFFITKQSPAKWMQTYSPAN